MPHVTTLLDLLEDARVGKVVGAAFGRPYRWRQVDVETFWTRIVRGFPSGTYTMWKPGDAVDRHRAGRGRLGPVVVAPDRRAAILLDGHARLATVAWSLHDPDAAPPGDMDVVEQGTWASGQRLGVDVDARRVRFVPKEECRRSHKFVPMGALVDARKMISLGRGAREGANPVTVEDQDWLDAPAHAVRTSQVVVLTLTGLEASEVREAFDSVTRGGASWSEDDLRRVSASPVLAPPGRHRRTPS